MRTGRWCAGDRTQALHAELRNGILYRRRCRPDKRIPVGGRSGAAGGNGDGVVVAGAGLAGGATVISPGSWTRRETGTATNSRFWNWIAVPGLPPGGLSYAAGRPADTSMRSEE